MPKPRRHSRHTKLSSGRPHQLRAQLLLHQVPALPHQPRRHLSTARTPGGRPDPGTSARSRPRRRPRGHVRGPLGQSSQPFMGTRTRPTTPPTSRPPLLVGHPFTTPPVQPIIPADLHRGRSPRISADSGRKQIFLAPGYSLVRRALWVQRFSPTTLPAEPHF